MIKYIDRKSLKEFKQDVDEFLTKNTEDGAKFFIDISPDNSTLTIFGDKTHGFIPSSNPAKSTGIREIDTSPIKPESSELLLLPV